MFCFWMPFGVIVARYVDNLVLPCILEVAGGARVEECKRYRLGGRRCIGVKVNRTGFLFSGGRSRVSVSETTRLR